MKLLLYFISFVCVSIISYGQTVSVDWAIHPIDSLSLGDNNGVSSVATDLNGNKYITGYYKSIIDFDPSLNTSELSPTVAGVNDIYIAKYNVNGNFVWAKKIGGIDYELGKNITVDNSGNVILAGDFTTTIDADPSANSTVISTLDGNEDAFIAKFDTDGNFLWVIQLGATNYDVVNDVACDQSGNIFITGTHTGTIDFDPSPTGTFNVASNGQRDIYLAKYDPSGNFLWANGIGGTGTNDEGIALATDPDGNVVLTGTYSGVVDFDPSVNTNSLTSSLLNSFIAKYNSLDGSFSWVKSIGARVASVDVSDDSEIALSGYFTGTADFDPSATTVNSTSAGNYDSFIAKYDSVGQYLWVNRFGGTGADQGYGVTFDAAGNIVATGYFTGTATFDVSTSGPNFSSASGSTDIYMLKFATSNGTYISGNKFGGSQNDYGMCITTDVFGNNTIAGTFKGDVDFDPTSGSNVLSSNFFNTFFATYNGTNDQLQSAVALNSYGLSQRQRTTSVVTDSLNNIYAVGFFNGVVDFDPDPNNNFNLTSNNYESIYLAKYSPFGQLIWVKSIAVVQSQPPAIIHQDAAGNLLVSCPFSGPLTIDGISVSYSGGDDLLLASFSQDGDCLWAKNIGSSPAGWTDAKKIVVDENNDIIVFGNFLFTTDFDPSSNTYNLSAGGTSIDCFIAKYDALGNFIWAKNFGGTSTELIQDGVVHSDGTVTVVGKFSGSLDFDPSSGTAYFTASGASDAFIARYDALGNFIWVKKIAGSGEDIITALTTNDYDDLFIGGYFSGTADLNPSTTATNNATSSGQSDVFFEKLDFQGNYIWSKTLPGTFHFESVTEIVLDSLQNIVVLGYFATDIDCDPSSNSAILADIGSNNCFLAKYTPNGDYLWSRGIGGGPATTSPQDITIDQQGSTIVVGQFDKTIQLNFPLQTDSITSLNYLDGFLVKYHDCIPVNQTFNEVACDTFVWAINDQIYSQSGTYSYTNLCGSVYTLNLTIQNSSTFVDVISVCDSLTWMDGITYTSSTNTPTWTIPNAVGCDSIITLNLTILNSNGSTTVVSSCNSYLWPQTGLTYTSSGSYSDTLINILGCDSVVSIALTINPPTTSIDTQISCEPFTWMDGITYYASTNSPTWTLPNAAGCDSIITLHLTILNQTTIVENTFSMPSDPNNCVGEFAVDLSGNGAFELDIDNGLQTTTSNGYSLFTGLCPGVHDLQIINFCGDTMTTPFVVPVDSNYVFNNPFIDSLAQDSLGTTLENCDIYYAGIDTAYIDSIWANGNTVNAIWNIVDSNGSNLDTMTYELNNGNGVYWLQLSVFCPTKALGDYFTVTEAIYFENGDVSTAGLANLEETNVLIYPNPTTNSVTISFDGTEANLTIYDAQGKLIKTSVILSGQQILLKDLETGVYFFEIQTEQGKFMNRIIKH